VTTCKQKLGPVQTLEIITERVTQAKQPKLPFIFRGVKKLQHLISLSSLANYLAITGKEIPMNKKNKYFF
jgi:hypothetical protein